MIDPETEEMIDDFFEDVLDDVENTTDRIDILEDIVFRADAKLSEEKEFENEDDDE